MKVTATKLSDVLVIEPQVFGDQRGYFIETFSARRYLESGIKEAFVQDNVSYSQQGTLRGLHYQLTKSQGKLVQVLEGDVLDVVLDVRRGSPTFGQWESYLLSGENHKQLYVPPGFAHGFSVLSKSAYFCYKCTEYYDAKDEQGILWNDPALAIDWQLQGEPVLSEKDQVLLPLAQMPSHLLPKQG